MHPGPFARAPGLGGHRRCPDRVKGHANRRIFTVNGPGPAAGSGPHPGALLAGSADSGKIVYGPMPASGGQREAIGAAQCPLLLAPGGGKLTDAAGVWGDGAADYGVAPADGVGASDGCSEIKRPGGEGRRGVRGMRRQDRTSRAWIGPAGRQLRLSGAKTAAEGKNRNS